MYTRIYLNLSLSLLWKISSHSRFKSVPKDFNKKSPSSFFGGQTRENRQGVDFFTLLFFCRIYMFVIRRVGGSKKFPTELKYSFLLNSVRRSSPLFNEKMKNHATWTYNTCQKKKKTLKIQKFKIFFSGERRNRKNSKIWKKLKMEKRIAQIFDECQRSFVPHAKSLIVMSKLRENRSRSSIIRFEFLGFRVGDSREIFLWRGWLRCLRSLHKQIRRFFLLSWNTCTQIHVVLQGGVIEIGTDFEDHSGEVTDDYEIEDEEE